MTGCRTDHPPTGLGGISSGLALGNEKSRLVGFSLDDRPQPLAIAGIMQDYV